MDGAYRVDGPRLCRGARVRPCGGHPVGSVLPHPPIHPSRWTPSKARAAAIAAGALGAAGFPLDLGRGQGETAGPRPVVKGWNGGRSRGWGACAVQVGKGGRRAPSADARWGPSRCVARSASPSTDTSGGLPLWPLATGRSPLCGWAAGCRPLGLAGRWTTPDGAAGSPSGGHQGVRGAPDGVHPPLCGWTPAPVAHSGPLDWMEYIEWMGRPHRGVLGSIRTQASRCAVHPHFGPLRWTPPRGRAEAPDPHHPCTAGFPLDLGRGQGETAGPRPVVKGWNGGRSRGWGNLREADGQGGERAEGL